MTLVRLRGRIPGFGQLDPLSAGIIAAERWRGASPVTLVDGQDVIPDTMLRTGFVNGEPADPLDLEPTDSTYCIRWSITAIGPDHSGTALVRFTSIPSQGPVDFGDLPIVDPTTFAPLDPIPPSVQTLLAQVEAASVAIAGHRRDVEQFAAEVDTDATRAGTSAYNAGRSAAAAQSSEEDALAYRDTAKTHRDAAELALGGSRLAQGAAEAAAATADSHRATAGASATQAAGSAATAGAYKDDAKTFANAAGSSASLASGSATAAAGSATAASTSATGAKTSETNAKTSETNAKASETNTKTSETNSKTSETNAASSAQAAQAATFAGTTPAANTSLDTLTTPGMYRITYGATVAQGAPFEGFYGSLEIQIRATGAVTQIARKHNALSADSRRFYQRTQTGAGWGAWAVYASQRIDKTAGIAIYTYDDIAGRDQLSYGDTGWRDVSALLSNGAVASGFLLRRVGSNVYVQIAGLQLPSSATGDPIYTLPTGFVPISTFGVLRETVNTGGAFGFNLSSVVRLYGNIGAAANNTTHRFQGVLSAVTDQPWPTTLPGAASGAIPNA